MWTFCYKTDPSRAKTLDVLFSMGMIEDSIPAEIIFVLSACCMAIVGTITARYNSDLFLLFPSGCVYYTIKIHLVKLYCIGGRIAV